MQIIANTDTLLRTPKAELCLATVLHSVHRKETRRATRVEAQCEAGVKAKQMLEYEEAEALSPHIVLKDLLFQ